MWCWWLYFLTCLLGVVLRGWLGEDLSWAFSFRSFFKEPPSFGVDVVIGLWSYKEQSWKTKLVYSSYVPVVQHLCGREQMKETGVSVEKDVKVALASESLLLLKIVHIHGVFFLNFIQNLTCRLGRWWCRSNGDWWTWFLWCGNSCSFASLFSLLLCLPACLLLFIFLHLLLFLGCCVLWQTSRLRSKPLSLFSPFFFSFFFSSFSLTFLAFTSLAFCLSLSFALSGLATSPWVTSPRGVARWM